jgi:hypothetical protein
MTYLRGVPSHGWYDPPDEPSDSAYEACEAAWREHLDDYCDNGCRWVPGDEDVPRTDDGPPCPSCAADPPMTYEQWQERYFDD